jgi:hypothetical protein
MLTYKIFVYLDAQIEYDLSVQLTNSQLIRALQISLCETPCCPTAYGDNAVADRDQCDKCRCADSYILVYIFY